MTKLIYVKLTILNFIDLVLNNIKKALQWLPEIKTVKKANKSQIPPCFHGLIQTLKGVVKLWDYLQGTQQYLLTNNLNQDPLENLFSKIRNNKGSHERNPSAFRFNRNLKQMCFGTTLTPETTTYDDADDINNLIEMCDLSCLSKLIDFLYSFTYICTLGLWLFCSQMLLYHKSMNIFC